MMDDITHTSKDHSEACKSSQSSIRSLQPLAPPLSEMGVANLFISQQLVPWISGAVANIVCLPHDNASRGSWIRIAIGRVTLLAR